MPSDNVRSPLPRCPRCASTSVVVCGQSVEYRPEEWPGQPFAERECRTTAYHCDCGLAFTVGSSGPQEHNDR